MIRLSREIRFSLTDAQPVEAKNSWAGWPLSYRTDPWLRVRVVVAGDPDPDTGFVCNVTELDRIVRDQFPRMFDVQAQRTSVPLVQVVRKAWDTFHPLIQRSGLTLARLEVQANSHSQFHIDHSQTAMVIHTQQFEFSAAHRLFNPQWSDEQNQNVFGKCNNPNGHGHNYVVEVSLELSEDSAATTLANLPAVVNRHVIDRLDHKHLNLDIDHFRSINPTVENIAVAIWQWLSEPLGDGQLHCVRVYETPKTWAEYRGP